MTVSELHSKVPKINFIKIKWVVNNPIVSLIKKAFVSEGP